MALSIGELVGYIDLDSGPAEGALEKFHGVLSGAGGKWSTLLAGAGVAVGGAFAASLLGAMNMEPAQDRVAAALGLTEAQAKRSGDVAGQLYSNAWGESADDTASAVEAILSSIKGMRNASEKDLYATTEAALAFSTAMGVDVGQAAQVAGQMVHNGLAKNATEAFDLLTKASSRVPKEMRQDMLDATDEYGQFFHTLGINGPRAMAMLVKGAQQGQYGIDKAGDAVKEFTIRSTDMSTTSKQAYHAIGLDAHKMANDILAGGGKARKATDKIVTGLLGIHDPAKRASASIALFGTPLEDLNTKDIPVFLRSLQSSGSELGKWRGATKKAGDTLNDNAKTNLEGFTRKLKMGFIDLLGGKVLPKVTEFTGALDKDLGPAISTVTDFLHDHKGAVKALIGVMGALVVVTQVHAGVLAVQSAGGMLAFLKSTRLITAVTKTYTAVQWLLNAALDANPIGLVVLALAALAIGLKYAWDHSETFRKVVTGALDKVGDAGRWLWNNVYQPVIHFMVEGFAKIVGGVADLLHALGKLPKMGWAEKAADALDVAADKAHKMADNIRDIPDHKTVNVRYNETTIKSIIRKQGNDPRLAGARAGGGPVVGGLDYLVGEHGPELFRAPTGGTVVPHGQLDARKMAHAAPPAAAPVVHERTTVERHGPLIGQVVQAPGESTDTLAERLWFNTRKRG